MSVAANALRDALVPEGVQRGLERPAASAEWRVATFRGRLCDKSGSRHSRSDTSDLFSGRISALPTPGRRFGVLLDIEEGGVLLSFLKKTACRS